MFEMAYFSPLLYSKHKDYINYYQAQLGGEIKHNLSLTPNVNTMHITLTSNFKYKSTIVIKISAPSYTSIITKHN